MQTNQQPPSPNVRDDYIDPAICRRDNELAVNSIFKTIQGEGIYAGHPATFIRLSGCNLQCPFCDTEYTYARAMRPSEIVKQLIQQRSKKLIVISGGEPFRQPIGELAYVLLAAGFTVQIETNGTLYRPGPWERCTIICSPKTGKVNHQLKPFISAYKYVAAAQDINAEDGLPDYALGHAASPRLARPHASFSGPVYLQPMDAQDHAVNFRNREVVVETCMKYGHILCLQIHKIIGVA